jgi:beta-glucosidase
MRQNTTIILLLAIAFSSCSKPTIYNSGQSAEKKADSLLQLMTLEDKIGQLIQKNGTGGYDSLVRAGRLGSILNETNVQAINDIQKIAVQESKLGIPLLFARDVIHGFKTILPIPLGQAATWNPELVESGAKIAATEARSFGIRWTFSPMIDVTRDPRWGRIAEGYGEDPYLTSTMGVSTIKGYQGEDFSDKNSILACAKHFAAYGAAEGGRDYNTVTLPENELRDVYLPPFHAAVKAGVATLMTGFNELNGIPVTGSELLLSQILRKEWGFSGFVVSDWESIYQLVVHGYSKNEKDAALKAFLAGCEMEMASTTFEKHLKTLIASKKITIAELDYAVKNILTAKFKIGLFDDPYVNPHDYPEALNADHKKIARELATQSIVLLKNDNATLPLSTSMKSIAIVGPLADSPHDQLGTWIFDGNKKHSITPLTSLQEFLGNDKVIYAKGMKISRTLTREDFPEAIRAAQKSEAIVVFLGEESILSGESHCRADLSLPGIQDELVNELSKLGKPLVAVVMAGRPLTFEKTAEKLDAILYAWHPGTMAGPAISDILFGVNSPSGKLPVTFPRTVGQIPIYYSHKNSGKPATKESWKKMYDIPAEAFQLSVGNTNHYIDYGFEPWFPFGFGLSYTEFEYSELQILNKNIQIDDSISVRLKVRNSGDYDANEVVQVYVQDLVGSRTRPVKELKRFTKVFIKKGDTKLINFNIHTSELGFYNQQMMYVTEPGEFLLYAGGNSKTDLKTQFTITKYK